MDRWLVAASCFDPENSKTEEVETMKSIQIFAFLLSLHICQCSAPAQATWSCRALFRHGRNPNDGGHTWFYSLQYLLGGL